MPLRGKEERQEEDTTHPPTSSARKSWRRRHVKCFPKLRAGKKRPFSSLFFFRAIPQRRREEEEERERRRQYSFSLSSFSSSTSGRVYLAIPLLGPPKSCYSFSSFQVVLHKVASPVGDLLYVQEGKFDLSSVRDNFPRAISVAQARTNTCGPKTGQLGWEIINSTLDT